MISANRYISEANGKFRIHPELKNRLPLWITMPRNSNGGTYPLTIATAPSSSVNFTLPNFNAETPGIALGKYLVVSDTTDGYAAAATTIKLSDVGYKRDFMAYPMHIRALFGTAQLPGLIHEPIIFDANSVIQGDMAKISGGSVVQYPYIVASQFYDEGANPGLLDRLVERKRIVSPFWMMPDNTTSVVLTSGQTLSYISQMSRGHFQAISLVAIATGNFSVEIRERRTGRIIMNGAISQSNGIGNAQYPYFLEAPFLIEKSSDLTWTFTDLSASGNTIWIALQGKLYNCPMAHIPEVERNLYLPWDKMRA